MRTATISAISLALLTLYACSDSNSDTIPSDGNGGAGGSSSAQAGSSARAGSAGSTIIGAAGDDTESAGSAATAGAAGATDAGAGNVDTAGAAGASTNTGGTSTGGGAGRAGGAGAAGAAGSPDDNGGSQIPAPPTGAAIDTTTSNFMVSVSWTDNSSDETGFNVYLSTDDNKPATPTATLPANAVEYDLKQVLAAQTYRVWVEAVNDAGVSSAAQITASAPTPDFAWNALYYDEATGNVYLAAQDMFGFLSDESYVTNLYGYHSASASLASASTAQLLDPTYTYPAASSGIDITIPQYFWVEARSTNGSLFSQRTLAPAGTVTNLQATTGTTSVTLTWDATPSATSYEVFYGTGSVAGATRLPDTTTTTALVPSLVPNTQYFFWVRAKATAIGGSGFPGLYGVTQATIVQ